MLTTELEKLLSQSIAKTTGTKSELIHLETPNDPSHGDLTNNNAMALAKQMQKNPRELAEEILKNIPSNKTIKKSEIAGPGFLNFWLTDEVFNTSFAELNKLITQEKFGHLEVGKDKKAITDTYIIPVI